MNDANYREPHKELFSKQMERINKKKSKSRRNLLGQIVLLVLLIAAMVYLSRYIPKESKVITVNNKTEMKTVTDFSLTGKNGMEVSLSEYKGKVLLIVNTATGCGFTPQYDGLEDMYKRLRDKGFEILDIPCNQFGNQTPGTDEEITEFCQVKFGTDFPQFKKSDVNGPNELPLYTWLKSRKGFVGFDKENKLTPILEDMFNKADPDWRSKSDIKWNFTKFLINRNGEVVERFEPTCPLEKVEAAVTLLL